jgi:Sec-independent protein secretion pathway component TatC
MQSLHTFLGMLVVAAFALPYIWRAIRDERWNSSPEFRYQVIWSASVLVLLGGLLGFTVGKLVAQE